MTPGSGVSRGVAHRLVVFAASLLAASLLVFLVCNALPGDIAQVILGENADPASVAALRGRLGLDRPWPLRYLTWVGGLCVGDLGVSYLSSTPVSALIGPNLGVTLWLVGLAMVLALATAVPVGMYAALRRRHWPGILAGGLSQVGMAVPAFFAGILLVLAFAVSLRWLPANGYVRLTRDPAGWASHLLLPVVSLASVQGSVLVRYVRSATLEVLAEDYFRTARATGWRLAPALLRHGLRNIALNVITVVGLQLATMLVGAIVVESVFQLPGLGQLLLTAVNRRDLGLVQAIVMMLVAAVLVLNAIVDALYLVIDPRLRSREVGT